MENTASSIVACWTDFKELFSSKALIKSVTIQIVQFRAKHYTALQVCWMDFYLNIKLERKEQRN
jgi:hypothetical protein